MKSNKTCSYNYENTLFIITVDQAKRTIDILSPADWEINDGDRERILRWVDEKQSFHWVVNYLGLSSGIFAFWAFRKDRDIYLTGYIIDYVSIT